MTAFAPVFSFTFGLGFALLALFTAPIWFPILLMFFVLGVMALVHLVTRWWFWFALLVFTAIHC